MSFIWKCFVLSDQWMEGQYVFYTKSCNNVEQMVNTVYFLAIIRIITLDLNI